MNYTIHQLIRICLHYSIFILQPFQPVYTILYFWIIKKKISDNIIRAFRLRVNYDNQN
jgi:hypothetical protein